MFHLHKISQLVSVNPTITVAEYERRLNAEGFTGGYRPVAGHQVSLSECLASRMPNLYFLKYGGIEDPCVGGQVVTPQNAKFSLKVAPRAATGPDLRRAIIGSQGVMGKFEEVVLRIFPLPEAESWGLALVDSFDQAVSLFRRLISVFIRPLWVKMMDEEEAEGVLRSLNQQPRSSCMMAFKLTGLKGMVAAEKEAIIKMYEGEEIQFYWPTRQGEIEVLDKTLMTPEVFGELMKKVAPLVGRKSGGEIPKAEQDLITYCKEGAC